MNKELREMLEAIQAKKKECKELLKTDLTGAKAMKNEIDDLQAKFEITKALFEDEEAQAQANAKKIKNPEAQTEMEIFLNAAKDGFSNKLVEGVKENGGYTVPEDIQTKINEYKESKDSLGVLVRRIPVATLSGSRTYKKREQQTGLVEVAEGAPIPEKSTPKYERQTFSVKKYAGFYGMTNEVLADSDANLKGELIKWIGDDVRVTENKLILAEVTKITKKIAVADLDDLKNIFNVELDPAFEVTSVVVTNQDGFNYLDKLKDADGKYLLQSDSTDKTKKLLFGIYPIKKYSNKTIPTVGGKAPIICGDWKEAIALYDRQKTALLGTNTAAGAFENDETLVRAIIREEVKTRDLEALVFGEITIASVKKK